MQIIFEWDANKARTNFEKHKVGFDEARTIFNDPFLVTFPDEVHLEIEERLISIGVSEQERILLVVHTEREETARNVVIRIISCRKATPTERKIYEEGE